MYFVSGCFWDKGKRKNNQDSLLYEQYATTKGRLVLAAVCDGIGGLEEGENASGMMAEQLDHLCNHQLINAVEQRKGIEKVKRIFLRCFYDTNKILSRYGRGKEIMLGTTASVLFLYKNRYLILHLGDSRIYLLHKNEIKSLTQDHKTADSFLCKCVGSFRYQTPSVYQGKMEPGMAFLLCTDGFYHGISDQDLPGIFDKVTKQEQIEKRLKEIGRQCFKRGEEDNASAIFIKCLKNGGEYETDFGE